MTLKCARCVFYHISPRREDDRRERVVRDLLEVSGSITTGHQSTFYNRSRRAKDRHEVATREREKVVKNVEINTYSIYYSDTNESNCQFWKYDEINEIKNKDEK